MDLSVWERIITSAIVMIGPTLAIIALVSGSIRGKDRRLMALFLFLFWPLTVMVLLAHWLYSRMKRPLPTDE